MQRPGGAPPQRPSSMNPLNFNRAASGAAGGAASNVSQSTLQQQQGAASGTAGGGAYNYLIRPGGGGGGGGGGVAGAAGSAGGNLNASANSNSSASSTQPPFAGATRGFPFAASSLPPHLAAFAASGQPGAGSALNSTDFPALGGGAALNASSSSAAGSANLTYANSTTTGARPLASGGGGGIGDLSTDDFPALNEGFAAAHNANGGIAQAAASLAAGQEQASAAATLQHQRLAREQNHSQQALNAARGGFGGEPERNYATKVGMQQPPGMSAAQNWFSANFGGGAAAAAAVAASRGGVGSSSDGNESGAGVAGLNGFAQSPAASASQLAAAFDAAGGDAAAAVASNLLLRGAPGGVGGASQVTQPPPPQTAFTPAQQVLTSPADRFGLLGLVSIIKMQDPDLTMMTLGTDLQQLGLNMNAQEALSTSFVTPWADNGAATAAGQMEPEFHLPSCYNVQPPPPPQSKIASFSDETLFFIFYSTPRDVLQEVAAQELYNRNWRFYRGGLNLWLTKEENVQPTHKDLRAEKGVYVFWDPATWSKVSREFVLAYDALEERSMGGGAVSPAQQMIAAQRQAGGGGGTANGGALSTPGMAIANASAAVPTNASPGQQNAGPPPSAAAEHSSQQTAQVGA